MNISAVMSIFGRHINGLQLCQCVRRLEDSGTRLERMALERVLLRCIGATEGGTIERAYGDGIRLNDLLPDEVANDEPEFQPLADCVSGCYDMEEHVMGCPHGPDIDIPYDYEPDYGAGEAADMKYRADMKDAGRGHLLR